MPLRHTELGLRRHLLAPASLADLVVQLSRNGAWGLLFLYSSLYFTSFFDQASNEVWFVLAKRKEGRVFFLTFPLAPSKYVAGLQNSLALEA